MAHYAARKAVIDGTANWQTRVNMQHWLRKRGYYAKNRECDGVWGYWTYLGLQQYMRTLKYPGGRRVYPGLRDGKTGPMTRKSMFETSTYFLGTRPGSKAYQQCAAYSCHAAWPHAESVKDWQYFLNSNAL